jgi:hypothetical protein
MLEIEKNISLGIPVVEKDPKVEMTVVERKKTGTVLQQERSYCIDDD